MNEPTNKMIKLKGLNINNSIIMGLKDVRKELNKKYSEMSLIRQKRQKKQKEINILLAEEERLIKEEKRKNTI